MKTRQKQNATVTEKRLSNIENSLREIQDYLSTSKVQMNSLSQVVQGIEEIKQNTKQKRMSLFPPKLSPKPPKPKVTQQVSELLQNPMILNMLIGTLSKPKSKVKLPTQPTVKKKTKVKGGNSPNLLNQFDWTSLLAILQNPALQSLLSTPSEATRPTKKQTDLTGRINVAEVMKLIQDPAIQSLLSKKSNG